MSTSQTSTAQKGCYKHRQGYKIQWRLATLTFLTLTFCSHVLSLTSLSHLSVPFMERVILVSSLEDSMKVPTVATIKVVCPLLSPLDKSLIGKAYNIISV